MDRICTSIEQSQRLIELGLDINTADMIYNVLGESYVRHSTPIDEYHTPAWSLTALLSAVKYNTINLHYNDERNDWMVSCTVEHSTRYESGRALNPIDACYEMIIKLKENNLL